MFTDSMVLLDGVGGVDHTPHVCRISEERDDALPVVVLQKIF
jgi:hypothetical protein